MEERQSEQWLKNNDITISQHTSCINLLTYLRNSNISLETMSRGDGRIHIGITRFRLACEIDQFGIFYVEEVLVFVGRSYTTQFNASQCFDAFQLILRLKS